MILRRIALVLAVAVVLPGSGCRGLTPPAAPSAALAAAMGGALMRVNVTRQGFYPRRPWQPEKPRSVSAVGVVLAGARVLVSADLVADHRHIELEDVETGARCRGTVVAADYEADLALLAGDDPKFMAAFKTMALSGGVLPGDRLEILQVQPGGRVVSASATVTTVELAAYPYGNEFLTYRLSGSIQNRHGNLTLPVVRDGRLAGMLRRDESSDQTLEVTPVELIDHFLQDLGDGRYDGFPLLGLQFVATRDPQLRRHVGLATEDGGVFVENVAAHSPAERAGIRVGDVIVAIDGHPIDSRGFYRDARLGRIGIAHLIRCGGQAGDTAAFDLIRQGRPLTVHPILDHRPARDRLVPPHHHDRPPPYHVLGGLVLQELSVPYLMDFGKDWTLNAPIHLLYLYRNQHKLNRPVGEKIVVLNSVLPTSATIGYESLNNAVIERINSRPVGRLEDVPGALAHPVEGFHCIEIDQPPFKVYLDAAGLSAVDAQVSERYRLPVLQRFGDR